MAAEIEQIGKSITRSHEHYLRHLLLFGKAVPFALKAIIYREEAKCGKTIYTLLDEKKDAVRKIYNKEFANIFPENSVECSSNIDSWNTRLLCAATLTLFESSLTSLEVAGIQIIIDQMKDLETSALSLKFNEFKSKWDPLQNALLDIVEECSSINKVEFNRMIISFKLERIEVNAELIAKLNNTTDIDTHVIIAMENRKFNEDKGEKQASDENSTDEKTGQMETGTMFIQSFTDTFVRVGVPIVLACRLNKCGKQAKWMKNDTELTETDTIKFVRNDHQPWLIVSNATVNDTGSYSCICGDASTTAYVKVTEQDLKVICHLHAVEKEIEENMDITLTCTVNIRTKKPVWLHNKQVIIEDTRVFASSLDLEHQLTIRNAKFGDEGQYVIDFDGVTSRTHITIKGIVDIAHKRQLTQGHFRNWIRGVLGLQYTKIGLEPFVEKMVIHQHKKILKSVAGTKCSQCTTENLLPHKQKHCTRTQNRNNCICKKSNPNRRPCPGQGFCSNVYDVLVRYHRYEDPFLKNSSIEKWGKDPWSVATCFINTAGYRGRTSATDIDCCGILSMLINNTKYLTDVDVNVFEQMRNVRNTILHNPNYELSAGELSDCIDSFKKVLEVKNSRGLMVLVTEAGVKKAIKLLDKLQKDQIDIQLSKDSEQNLAQLRNHALSEVAEKFLEAEKQKERQLQEMDEKLKETEKELKLMHELRKDLEKKKQVVGKKASFDLEVHLRIGGSSKEAIIASRNVHSIIKDEIVKRIGVSDVRVESFACRKTLSVRRLLASIMAIEDTQIDDALRIDSSTEIQVKCFSFEAIEKVIALINGQSFKKEIVELRKCLEMEDMYKQTFDVAVNCDSSKINCLRKLLDGGNISDESTADRKDAAQGTTEMDILSSSDFFKGSVTKVKNKKVTHNIINIYADREIYVQAGNGHAVPSIDIRDMACELSCADHHSQGSTDEPQMEFLKFPVNKEGDSGIVSSHASSEPTYVKRPY